MNADLITNITQGIAFALALGAVAFWVYALGDVMQRDESEFPYPPRTSNDKLVWLVIVVFLNVVGATGYYTIVMRDRPRSR